MIIKDILKVIYSPVKAFESIVKKPDVRGPFIILALILVSAAIEQYVFASKILLSDRTPTNDQWTEPNISPSWNWTSNGINRTISFDNITVVIGNYSVRSEVLNGTDIWMNITNIRTLNCVGNDGYKGLSFWINWTRQPKSLPDSATLRLFSTNENRYFELDLRNLISSENWIRNWTIPTSGIAVGPDQGWIHVNSPHWENITGVGFMLKWSQIGNLTMNIDDLYFVKKPFSFLSTASASTFIFSALISQIDPPSTVLGFFLTWIVYLGSFFLVSSIVHQRFSSWRALFIVIGYTFAVGMVGILVRAIIYSSLPTLNLPVSSLPSSTYDDSIRVRIMEGFWYPSVAYPLAFIAAYLGLDIWIVALCAVSARALGGLSWKRAIMIAAIAYLVKTFLLGLGSMI